MSHGEQSAKSTVPIRGEEDAAQALREWLIEEVKDTAKLPLELGKHLLTVSTGSVLALLFLQKDLALFSQFDKYLLWLGLLSIGVSALLSVMIVLPKVYRGEESSSLQDLHRQKTKRVQELCIGWLCTWIFGTVLCVLSIIP